MTTQVIDVPDQQRSEILRNGTTLGFAAYQKSDQMVVFTHTEVDSSAGGQGIGGQLIRGALDLQVLPICPFAPTWMSRHPDYLDLDYRRPH